jgi:hypothetical protein
MMLANCSFALEDCIGKRFPTEEATSVVSQLEKPAFRPLKVYAFDPSLGRYANNHMTVKVRFENLKPGPVGEYLAVVDYDTSNDCYYEAIDLDSANVLIRGGMDPTESDPRFHQQMAYAVASETIRRFEFALGRKIKWKRPRGRKTDPYRRKLRIFPHGIQEANAFYDPDLRALIFGYFPSGATDPSSTVPGQTIFTCLSHDIIVHETTHALIDGLRENFIEATNPDTPAFHEAFADIVAIFQHFSLEEAVLEVVQRTGGLLYRPNLAADAEPQGGTPAIQAEHSQSNPLLELARQFGEGMGMRTALRSALGQPPNSKAIETAFEPHARGAILVAAVFDAFFSVYVRRTRDLLRFARAGASAASMDLQPDLAKRLAKEAAKVAEHFLNICIRSLDYCPPIDIRFGEFLRALITADSDLVVEDSWGYRTALIEAFRSRGIVPEAAPSYSEEDLRWRAPAGHVPRLEGLRFNVIGEESPAEVTRRAILLSKYARANAEAFGLSPRLPIHAFSFHPVQRVSPEGFITFGFVAELLQKKTAPLDPSNPRSSEFAFRGGSTIILDQHCNVLYTVYKRIENDRRLQQQRDFHQRLGDISALAPYVTSPAPTVMKFSAIHRGY